MTRTSSRRLCGIGRVLVAALCVSGAADAANAEEGGLTLAGAVQRALDEGYRAQIARLETGQAGDRLDGARGQYLPRLSVTSNAGYSNRINEKIEALDGNSQLRVYPRSRLGSTADGWFNFFVDQLIFDLEKWKLIERDELAAEVADLTEAHEREQIAFEVTQRYADLVRIAQLRDAAAADLESAGQLDRQAGLVLEAGRALASDRERAALHLSEVEIELLSVSDQLEDARALLQVLIGPGERSDQPLRVLPHSLPEPTPPSPEAAEELVVNAPDLRVLDLRRRMEEATVAAERARRMPTLAMRGGYVNYGIKRFDDYQDELFIGVDINIPIFDGFQTRSAVAGALKAAEVARLRYRSELDKKRVRIRELERLLASSSRRVALAERRADSAREQRRLADLNLKAERGGVAEAVFAHERSAFDTRNAIESRYDRLEAWATLQLEMGQLAATLTHDRDASRPASAEP